MITGLDHVGLAVADPGSAARAYALLFGSEAGEGRRFQLANTAFEIAAGSEPAFSLGLATDNADATRRLMERRGLAFADAGLDPSATHGVRMVLRARRPDAPPPGRPDAPHLKNSRRVPHCGLRRSSLRSRPRRPP